jgi:nitrite reductase/ring-hydroxylating ferredoxin subunit
VNSATQASERIELTEWSFVVDLEGVPKGKQRCVNLGEASLIVCRVYDEVYVLQNHCPHLGKPLEGGRLQEYELSCPHHNAVFDIRDGKAVMGPSVWPARIYPCRVEDGKVYVQISETEDATPFVDPRMRG